MIKCIPDTWLDNYDIDISGVHETIVHKLVNLKKVPQNSYCIMRGSHSLDSKYDNWGDKLNVPETNNWETVHKNNFFCSINTKLRSFYFRIFHKAIALNDFLYKIKRKESPSCSFCDKEEESIIHLFCECERVVPLWQDLLSAVRVNNHNPINVTNFEKLFGIPDDKFVTYLFLLLKFYINTCKFTNCQPNIIVFKSFVKKQKEIEYTIAKKRNKLHAHFRKWRFII